MWLTEKVGYSKGKTTSMCTFILVLASAAFLNSRPFRATALHVNFGSLYPGAHKRKEHVISILYHSNQEVKSSASGCGVMWLDDYHIRLVCCSAVVMTRNPYELMAYGFLAWVKCTVFGN